MFLRQRKFRSFFFAHLVAAMLASLFVMSTPASVASAAGECPTNVANTVTWTYTGGKCLGIFVSSTTWTPPAGVTSVDYFAVGGGGGGTGQVAGTNKGGAGGSVLTGTVAVNGTALTVTVGGGGAGGNPGAAGGASQLVQGGTNLFSATGGAGNSNSASGVGTGTTSSFSGTSAVYGAKGGPSRTAGGTNAGNGADSSGGCAGGGNAVANYGGGGGAGDQCFIGDFGYGPVYSYTVAGSGGSGIVMVKYVAFGVTSLTTAMSALTNSATSFTYTLTFVSAVDATTLSASDFSNGGTSTGCVFTPSPTTGTATSFTITVTGCGDGTVIPTLATNAVTSSTGVNGPGAAYPGATVTIDTTAPSAPSSNDLVTASDTGTSTSDNYTSDNTPTMSAAGGSTGDTVTMTATNGGTTKTCTYVLPATSCTLPTLSDGVWQVTSTLTDPANNTSPSSPALPITIDTSAPTASAPDLVAASDTGASDTDNLTKSSTPSFSVPNVADGDTVTISAVNGGTTKTCTYVASPSVTSCAMSGITAGTWSVTSTVTDQAGNVSPSSSALTMTVDTTAPSAPSTPDLAAASDTGSSNTDNNTSDNTPTMSATGGVNGETITISAVNGGTTVSCSYVLPATSCDLPALSDGIWSVTSTLTDAAGNTSAASSALSMVIDATPSSAPVSAPDLAGASDTGSSNTDNNTSDNTPTMSGAGGATGDKITITATDGTNTVSCNYTLPSTSCDLPAMADGSWSISYTITDPAGNVSPPSAPLNVVIDSTPDTGNTTDLLSSSDLGSSNSDNLTSDNTPSMAAIGATNGQSVTITATNGGVTKTCSYVVGVASSCDLPTLSDGTWIITNTVTDLAGNISSPSAPLSVVIDTSIPSAPGTPDLVATSDLGNSSTDNLTADTTPTMSLTGGTTGDTATITATDGTHTVSCTYVIGSATSCDLPALTGGTWTMTGTITDPAGNTSTAGGSLSVVIDATPPTAPTAAPDLATSSDTGQSSSDNYTSDKTPTMNVAGGVTGDTVTVSATKDGVTVSCTFVVGNATSCDLPALADGTWTVVSTFTDTAGNVSAPSAPLSLTIDTTTTVLGVPDLVDSSDTGVSNSDNITGDLTPSFSNPAAAPGDVVTVIATKGDVTVSCTYLAGTATSCELPPLTDGKWSIVTEATDLAGNVSKTSPIMLVVMDETLPATPSKVVKGQSAASAQIVHIATYATKKTSTGTKVVLKGIAFARVVYFNPASALLDRWDRSYLDRVVMKLKGKKGALLVTGFARQNLVDTANFLLNLSIQRALAVSEYLVAHGVKCIIKYDGVGARTKTEGKPEDRKVELRWSKNA